MPDLLEAVEYAAWQLAAEPVEWRMDHLLKVVRDSAEAIAGTAGAPRASVKPESVGLLAIPDSAVKARHPASQDDQEATGSGTMPKLALVPPIPEDERQKDCRGCGKPFPLTGYPKDSTRADGHKSRCRQCESLARQERKQRGQIRK